MLLGTVFDPYKEEGFSLELSGCTYIHRLRYMHYTIIPLMYTLYTHYSDMAHIVYIRIILYMYV